MSDRIAVGQLAGVFGVKGWVKVRSSTEPEKNIVDYQPWFLKTPHGLKEVVVDDFAIRPQGLVVHIKDYDDRDQALALGKAVIEVNKSLLPGLNQDDFYWHELIGLKVHTVHGQPESAQNHSESILLGEVKSLLETGANDVLVVKPCSDSIDDRERLVPYLPGQFVLSIQPDEGFIQVDWDPDF